MFACRQPGAGGMLVGAVLAMAAWMGGELRSGTWVEPQAMVDTEGEGVWQWTAGKIGNYRGQIGDYRGV